MEQSHLKGEFCATPKLAHAKLEEEEKEERGEEGGERSKGSQMVYKVNDTPPFYLTFLLAVQQCLMTIPGTISIPLLLAEVLCTEDPATVRARLCGITFFLCGLATVIQCTLGVRLPIIQGGSHTFLPPVFAMLALDRWKCQGGPRDDPDQAWMERMREIQGNLMLASLTQVVLGCTGLLGFLLRFIGPLTVAPTIALIGLSLTNIITMYSQCNWPIAFMTMGLVVVFSLLLGRYKQPVFAWSREKGCYVARFPFIQLFSVILAMFVSWLVCLGLTVADVIPNNSTNVAYHTRTDTRLYVLREVPWVSIPYPFPYGMPTVTAAGYLGMLAATLASIVESVGDYLASARACDVPLPPSSAINRGVAMEGLASIFSGMLGAGHATTSYSGTAGSVNITKVASLRVFQIAGVLMMLLGVLGKLGAAFSLLPDPVVGGILGVILAMVASIGLSTALHADMATLRNRAIFGLAVTIGLALPQWVLAHPDRIRTGNTEMDQVVAVLLGTPMCVGGFIGCFLDNLVPGTARERGLVTSKAKPAQDESGHAEDTTMQEIYDLPYVSDSIRKISACAYVPISPSYQDWSFKRWPLWRNCKRQRKSLCPSGEVLPVNGDSCHVKGNSVSDDSYHVISLQPLDDKK